MVPLTVSSWSDPSAFSIDASVSLLGPEVEEPAAYGLRWP